MADAPSTPSGADVRALRERLGLSQVEMAAALGLSRGTSVSELETGARPVTPTIARLLAYVERYGPEAPRAGQPAVAGGLTAEDAATLRGIADRIERLRQAGDETAA